MSRIRTAVRLASILTLLGFSTLQGSAEEVREPVVSLRWALGALDQDEVTPSAVKRDTRLDSGTRLKFLVEPLSPGSIYLILLDSDDAIHVLLRQSDGTAGEGTYVPPGSQWFELDDESGLETFFLLASVEPLSDLDALLAGHETADPSARSEIGKQIVAEILRLNKAHRSFSRPVEKPVMIGGQMRGGAPGASAIDRLAVDVSAERFYGKTISIDH